MRTYATVLLFCFLLHVKAYSQEIKNPFFGLYSIIGGDSVYNTFEKQVKLVKESGYDGIEISGPEDFIGMKSALDKLDFHGAYFYFMVDVDQPRIDPKLKNYISALKGTNTILAPYIQSSSNRYKTASAEADAKVVKLLRQLSGWARKEDLQIAIYPHFGYYVQRIGHVLKLVKQINRKNTGMSFNLCHWLATTPAEERGGLKSDLMEILPYLRMVTICGANDLVSDKKVVWDDYILPLGMGSFDTYGLVEYLIKDLHFKGPFGVQCYGLKDDKAWLVKHSMETWNNYKMRMENGQ
ncbi:MAG: TIM barrel protein [Bacteroidota bacterium]|nr:TIM barrel protein [Bacteroidota bacterium]MDP4213353.1 TIM barrel protein [Bacteroidota bacterium]MDP4252317.1 TIM barrel protein [Bacteroidota bacterium]